MRARSTGDRVITGMEEKLAVVPPIPSRRYMISPPLPTDHFSRAEQVYHSMKIDFAAGVFHRSIEGADQGDGRVDEGCRCAPLPSAYPSLRGSPPPGHTHGPQRTHRTGLKPCPLCIPSLGSRPRSCCEGCAPHLPQGGSAGGSRCAASARDVRTSHALALSVAGTSRGL